MHCPPARPCPRLACTDPSQKHFPLLRFVRELSEEEVMKMETDAEAMSALGELHADEFNPYGQAYVQAEEA